MDLSREQFEQQHRPQRGSANPERMLVPFWDWMVRGAVNPRTVDDDAEGDEPGGPIRRGSSPYHARQVFPPIDGRPDAPIWTLERMGATRTDLPDGRVLWIGGEHEDYYDPDFYIYNDVIVFDRAGGFAIYGYPVSAFPPTDFHTATRVDDRIILIGSLGYPEDRRPGTTQVLALDLADYRIEPVATEGESPNWLSRHEAELDPAGQIVVRGGQVLVETCGRQGIHRNYEDYALDLATSTWRRLTARNRREFTIRPARGWHWEPREPRCDALYPGSIEHSRVDCHDWSEVKFLVRGVLVHIQKRRFDARITIEGDLPVEPGDRIAQEVRAGIEADLGRPCLLI